MWVSNLHKILLKILSQLLILILKPGCLICEIQRVEKILVILPGFTGDAEKKAS
jgi:hypothetical protein